MSDMMTSKGDGDHDLLKTLIKANTDALQGLVSLGVFKFETLEQSWNDTKQQLELVCDQVKRRNEAVDIILANLEAKNNQLEKDGRDSNVRFDNIIGQQEVAINNLTLLIRDLEGRFNDFEAEKKQLFEKRAQDDKIKEVLKKMKFYEDKKKNLEEEFKEIHTRIDSLQTFWRERVLMYIGIGGFLLPKPDCNDWLTFSSILLFGIMELFLSVYWIYTSLRSIFKEIDQLVSDNSDIQGAALEIIGELKQYDDEEIEEVYTSQLDGLRVSTFDTITSKPLPGTKMKIIHGAWIIIPFLVSIIFGVIVAYRQAKTCTNPPSAISPSSTLSFI